MPANFLIETKHSTQIQLIFHDKKQKKIGKY